MRIDNNYVLAYIEDMDKISTTPPITPNKSSGLARWLLNLLFIALSFIIGYFVFYFAQYYGTFYADNIGTIWIVLFLTALVLRVKYTELIFFVDLVLAGLLVSFVSLGQGYISMLLLIVLQKLFKLI